MTKSFDRPRRNRDEEKLRAALVARQTYRAKPTAPNREAAEEAMRVLEVRGFTLGPLDDPLTE